MSPLVIVFTGTNTDLRPITAEQQNLSGTNVNVNITVGSGYVAGPPNGIPQVEDASVSEIEIYILSDATPDDILPAASNPQGSVVGSTQSYRLATTYFEHDDPIRFRAKCTFTFTHSVWNGRTSTDVEFDEYLEFNAYNVLLPLATNLNGIGQVDGDFQAAGDATTNAASTALSPSHLTEPGAGAPARSVSVDDLIAGLLRDSTVMAAFTHGFGSEGGGFEDSAGDNIWWNEQINIDVADRIATKVAAGVPGYTFVAFWSCASLQSVPGAPANNAPSSFGIGAADEAFVGFANVVSLDCWTASKWEQGTPSGAYDGDLSDHAAEFWLSVWEGATVREALDSANLDMMPHYYDPVTQIASQLPMEERGDELTRLIYVYLDADERALLGGNLEDIDVWLIKTPIQAQG